MAKIISILGSTGSIGVQTLEAARNLGLQVYGLSCGSNIDLLEKQIHEFCPKVVSIHDPLLAEQLAARVAGMEVKVVSGLEGTLQVAAIPEVDTVVSAMVGISGLIPTMHAIRNKKNIALANKETLVTAGGLVMEEARRQGVHILPVDSEHSAIFQCLMGNTIQSVHKIILTASGGPFRGYSSQVLEQVTVEQALRHPNWSMGSKITIDSATLMNKGLEVIEAKWLFQLELEQIQVVVHPQSVIHSMVEYTDGSVMAQLGSPDMRIPIQFALTYPERKQNTFSRVDFLQIGALTFEEPDKRAFPCLQLALEAQKGGGTMPVALNAANEAAVALFLQKHIGFMDIPRLIEKTLGEHVCHISPTLEDIIEVDEWARAFVHEAVMKNH